MGLENSMKPVVFMLVAQVVLGGVHIFFKLAISSGVSLPVLIAYRYLISTAVMVPLAFFFYEGTRPKMTWKIIFQSFLCGLFGGTLFQNLYLESMDLTSATFVSAMANLLPAVTFIVSIFARLERLELGTKAGKAKVIGTFMGMGGAMLFTFYKGFSIDIFKSNINLLLDTNNNNMALPSSHHNYVMGACLAIASIFSFAIWINIQAKMSETLPCHYTCTALMSVMAFFQSTIYALCVDRDWSQWKLGWNIRLWTVVYTGTLGTALVVALQTISARLRGPLFVAIFNPLVLIIVAFAGVLFLDEKFYLGSVLGAIMIIFGLYVVLWGKYKEMKNKRSELVPLEEIEAQNSTENILENSTNNERSNVEMKTTENDMGEKKEIMIDVHK